jgi:hypothetical protein
MNPRRKNKQTKEKKKEKEQKQAKVTDTEMETELSVNEIKKPNKTMQIITPLPIITTNSSFKCNKQSIKMILQPIHHPRKESR